tara:strand:+ start:1272 stop:1670 length:399 start_codon:yes stop_codon:yes gene_type:complete
MTKVDIGDSTAGKPQQLLLWAILVAFAWFVFVRSGPEPPPTPPPVPSWPDAVVLVPPVGIAGSTKIDEWGAANNVEIRRYQAGADLSNAEPWVQELYKLSDGQQPCAVVFMGDGVEIIPIEDDLLTELEGLR